MPCLILRIGFVGELGYEIHCPAAAGEALWDALLEAGAAPAAAFGLEPQRVLRLEKVHVIVGQDTNAETNPLEAAMPWIVKLDKESDWIGRSSIEFYKRRGERNALVGFVGDNGKVPVEGSRWWPPTATRSAHHQLALLGAAWARRSGSPGCRSAWPRRARS